MIFNEKDFWEVLKEIVGTKTKEPLPFPYC